MFVFYFRQLNFVGMDSQVKNGKQVRAILWSVPRSLSTVFEKCLSFVPNTQIINEPFSCAYHMGPEMFPPPEKMRTENKQQAEQYNKELNAIEFKLPMAFDAKVCTYDFVRCELEAEYPGKDLVFCKDMAYGLQGKYDIIPEGYRHTFIIRNPYRMFLSYRRLLANVMKTILKEDEFRFCELPGSMLPKNYAFQEQYELMTYLQQHGEPDPIIVDADDLLTNPASIMRQYCTLLGIPFKKDMLEWPAGLDIVKTWKGGREILLGNLHASGGYYDAALRSTRFNPPKDMPLREDLTEDILKCVDHSMPFYEKMYAMRLK